MKITYQLNKIPTPQQIVEVYENAGLPRPTRDIERIRKMYENADVVVSAWDGDILVGVSRSITDWVWSCYLADLAVRQEYKKMGIGKKLIDMTKETVGNQSMVLLLSVPDAMEYYPRVGFTNINNAFIINRFE